MFYFKSKSVYGQAYVAFCLLLVLTVFEPVFAKIGGRLNQVHPEFVGNLSNSGMGRISLASIKIDTTSQYIEHVAYIPIYIRNDIEFSGFEMEVDFPYQYLTFIGAERGLALSDTSNGEYNWEKFTYRLLPTAPADTLYKCLLTGMYDIPDGSHIGIPLAPHSNFISLVILKFWINNGGFPPGTFFPLTFEWESSDCEENTFFNVSGDTVYVSQDSAQFNSIDCPPDSLDDYVISESLEFTDGGVHAFEYSPSSRGDININTFPYEEADLQLFSYYLQIGEAALFDTEQQSANSDVNWDDFRWSMADFIHLSRVINHDADPVLSPTNQSQNSVQTWLPTVHALPNDIVFLPVIYHSISGSEPVYGISFRVDYNPDSLTLIGVDFSKTPLQNWQAVYTRLEDGSVWVNACPEFFTTSLSSPLTVSSSYQELARLSFRVADVDTPVFIPVRFSTDTTLQVQPNAFATIDGSLTRLGVSNLNNGGIQVGGSIECQRGDINFNTISYEVADLVLFHNFLLYGSGMLIYDQDIQTCASDVNFDSICWTIADFLYMDRIIHHDAVPFPISGKDQINNAEKQPSIPSDISDEYKVVSSSAHPGDVVSVPIWLSNSMNAWGATFRIIFNSNFLSVESIDTLQTRIGGWGEINPVINPGELFFFAYPDWDLQHPFLHMDTGKGVLMRVNFKVNSYAPPRAHFPITFITEPSLGHYNAYTDTTGLFFVQPSTLSGWIYTDVISGDANSDGVVDVGDVVYLINYLYRADMPPSPVSLGDFNHDSEVNISDVVALINYLFRS